MFLGRLLAGGALVLHPGAGCAQKKRRGGAAGTSRVVLVRSGKVVSAKNQVDGATVRRMLALGLSRLAGGKDARAALGRWVRPVDTVGLKVNCLAGRQMSTRLALVEALVALLEQTGLPRRRCVVFDRSDLDLRRAGYPVRVSGDDYRSMGNDRGGYEERLRVMPSGASRFSKIAAGVSSVLVNMPVLKDHGLAGISGALKNNFGLVHNPNKFHLNGCDPHVSEVNARRFIRDKQRLVICDALRVQVEGGPAFHAAGAQTYGGILLATDPVALDVVAWELLEELRKKRKLPSLTQDKRRPVHILTAARAGLGVGDRRRIQLIKVKV